MTRFTGKTAVVTGAGSGIGLATAQQMVADGARVIAVDIDAKRLEEGAALVGPAYVPLALDLERKN